MSLTASLHRNKSLYGNKSALIFQGRTTTFAEMYRQVACVAGALSELDLEQNARVGILAINSDRAIVSLYASSWAGLIPNNLNIRWSPRELADSINDCAASVLFVDDLFMVAGLELQKACPSVKYIVHIGENQDLPEGVLSFNDLVKQNPIEDRSASGIEPAFLNYTGGTTGKSKGVVHTHDGHLAAMTIAVAENLFIDGVSCFAVPMFHIAGISVISGNMQAGNTLVIPSGFDPSGLLQTLSEHRVEHLFMVPTMLKMMIDVPTFADYDLSGLRQVAYGASPIDESLLSELQEKLPQVRFMQLYGQTECVPATVLHNCDHAEERRAAGRTRSAGVACFGVSIEIRDAEGDCVSAGQVGEVAIRGPHRMQGYWNKTEQTAEVFDGDWLLTGDAGYLSEDGYLHIVDRVKDMIISGGENIYSLEVENAISLHTSVAQCAVVGLPDEKWGEVVHAEVVVKEGEAVNEEELTTHCRQYLGSYKLAKSIRFVAGIPITAVGKIDKVAIRQQLAEES